MLKTIAHRVSHFRQYSFFTVSLLCHLILILTLGGVVLYKEISRPDMFVGRSFIAEEAPEEGIEEEVPVEFTEPGQTDGAEKSGGSASVVNVLRETAFSAGLTTEYQVGNSLNTTRTSSMAGMGRGTGAGGIVGGGKGMASSFFGVASDGSGLNGYYYDLKRNPQGGVSAATEGVAEDQLGYLYLKLCKDIFDRKGEPRASELAKYFRAPSALSTFTILLPFLESDSAPKAFGVGAPASHPLWMVNYKGRIKPERAGRFRFVGGGDELLIVRVNGRLVLDGTWQNIPWETPSNNPTGWTPEQQLPGLKFSDTWKVGEWFEARGPFELEITVGEGWGGAFAGILMVEESGENYDNRPRPLFKIEGYEKVLPLLEPVLKEHADYLTLEGPTFRPAR